MRIKIEEKYSAVILQIKGNMLGGPEAKEFSETLHKLLDEGKTNIIVDLSGVKFMNSSGLGMLISGYTTIKNGGGKFILCGATEKINSLLVITKLITIFENYNSIDEALNSLNN